MPVLSDTSNLQQQDAGAQKRPRLAQLQQPATFDVVVERAGIRGLVADVRSGICSSTAPPEMDDPRHTKRQLNTDLSTAAAQQTFLDSLAEAMASDEILRRCLLPIKVTVQVNYETGDSLIRMLLNILPMQQRLATVLLQKLPEYSAAECEDARGAGEPAGSNTSSIPSLILGQLSWLEVTADASALTAAVLEVLPVCSASIQQQLIGILPEVVQPEDHAVALEQLQGLLESDLAFMAAVLECLSNMQLEPALQEQVLLSLLAQLPAIEVEDVPGLVKFLISSTVAHNAEQVLSTLRSNLHFASPSDPRLAVPDRRQKGPLQPSSRSPEVQVVKELVLALQTNEAAATACLQLQAAIQEPGAHRCFDLLVLLAMHAKGGSSKKTAEACLSRKFLEGHVDTSWITQALQGHQACYRDQLWPSLLALAETWSSSREAALAAAAAALYVQLFVAFDAPLERQQVLHALHGQLGSGVAGQQDVALQALSGLATSHQPLLRAYSSYLANILDHLESFSNAQLQQVFSMFASLTARQPAAAGADGAGSSTAASTSSAGGSRLEDELVITLNKALAQAHPGYKRIGVVGMLALLQQEGADYELLLDAQGSAADALKDSWLSRAESVFSQCMSHPGVFAFLLDQWAELLEAQARRVGTTTTASTATAGVQGAGALGAASGNPATTPHIPEPMLQWMHDKVNELLIDVFTKELSSPAEASEMQDTLPADQQQPTASIQLDDSNLKVQLWFNLDGAFTPVCLQLLSLTASRDPSKRAQLVWLPPALRLLAAIAQILFSGQLTNIDALLGCPLALPDRDMFRDGQWDTLPLSSKVAVLTSLQHAICWLREVVAVFGPSISTDALMATAGTENTQATMDHMADIQNKLLMRVAQLRAVEALFKDLASSCPAAAQQLPDLSYPLLLAPAAARAGLPARQKAGAASGGKAESGGAMACDVMCLLRCLRPPAVVALNSCQPPHMLLTSLLPATHLAADLYSKLKLLVSRARRPAGLAAVTAAGPTGAAIAGAGASGLAAAAIFTGVTAPAGPPCLEGQVLRGFAKQIGSLLPSVQQHLAMALSVIRQPPQGGLEVLFSGLPGYGDAGEAMLFGLPAVQGVAQALPAAHCLAMSCLQTFTLLLGCSKELSMLQLQDVLAALALQPAPAAAAGNDRQQVHTLLISAFKASRKLSCRSSGNSNLQLELAVLSLLQAVATLAAAQDLPAEKQAAMSSKMSKAAAELLQESWKPQDEADDDEKGFSWKGQSAAINQLLAVLISHSPDPSQEVLSLVQDALSAVPDKVPGKEQLSPVAGYAALCSATFATWYKVIFEQLLAFWTQLTTRAMSLLTAGGDAGTSTGAAGRAGGRGKRQQKQQLQLNSQGEPGWDADQVEDVVQQAHRCAQAFAALIELTKKHKTRNVLLGTALKVGGSFVDAMVKSSPFWHAYYTAYGRPFLQLVKTVQKGTKVMQAICSEGKVRGGSAVVSRAPAAKRSLERFVFEMQGLFLQAGEPPEAITVGFLKHRDIEGNAMPSQLFPEPDEEEDEDEDEEMAEDDAAEDDNEEEGSAAGS